MDAREHVYRVCFDERDDCPTGVLVEGRDFRFNEEVVSRELVRSVPVLAGDLMRVGMAVYVADRLARRSRRRPDAGGGRVVRLTVQVARPDFWLARGIQQLVVDAVKHLSEDVWDIRFEPGSEPEQVQGHLQFPDRPVVCLYSGGLDSASGLARQLRDRTEPMLAVTARHQPGQRRRVEDNLRRLGKRYGARVHPVIVTTTLIDPPRMSQQERTQRCRSFLFAALAAAAASAADASSIEVYESGVGAINLPPMAGMLLGPRASKSCHPEFLRLMSNLAGRVAGRPIAFRLPYADKTKAELVRTLVEDGLEDLARQTVSCARYPQRVKGSAKQCGYCAACIGRRQALLAAGLKEPCELYQYDLFRAPDMVNEVPRDKLAFLKAAVMQVCHLRELQYGRLPALFRNHVFGTRVVGPGESVQPWIDVLLRYRREWLDILSQGRAAGWRWANWLPVSESAA